MTGILHGLIGSFNSNRQPVEFIGYVATSNPQTSSTIPSKTLTLNAGWLSTDFLICAVSADVTNLSTASGWTLGNDGPSNNPSNLWMYRVKGTATSVSVPVDSAMIVMCFRNVDTSNPFDATPVEASGATGDPDSASITTVTNNAMLVAIGYIDDDLVTTNPTSPTGFTFIDVQENNGTYDKEYSSVMAAYKLQETAGTVDPAVWDTTADDEWWATTIALRPL